MLAGCEGGSYRRRNMRVLPLALAKEVGGWGPCGENKLKYRADQATASGRSSSHVRREATCKAMWKFEPESKRTAQKNVWSRLLLVPFDRQWRRCSRKSPRERVSCRDNRDEATVVTISMTQREREREKSDSTALF